MGMENTPVIAARRTVGKNLRTALIAFPLVLAAAFAVFLLLNHPGRLETLFHADQARATKEKLALPGHFTSTDAYTAVHAQTANPLANNNWMNGIRGN